MTAADTLSPLPGRKGLFIGIRESLAYLRDPDHFIAEPALSGVFQWDDASRTAIFIPTGSLDRGMTQAVTLTEGIATPDGVPLQPYSFSFTVAGEVGTTPTLPTGDAAVYTDGTWSAWFAVDDPASPARTYTITTDHPQRDYGPTDRIVTEVAGEPVPPGLLLPLNLLELRAGQL